MVYVDTDPVAIAHSKAILAGDDKATIIEADLREPEAILGHPETRRLIDFTQPVGLLMVAVLHFIRDEKNPGDLVKRLTRPLTSGSYLTISHGTSDHRPASVVTAMGKLLTGAAASSNFRRRDEIRAFFDGFDLLDPGLVFNSQWRPDGPEPFIDQPERSGAYAGVGRRP